ncbi:hypothetical protein DUNSADRAFT_4533 [Dunaliella salina]|uniref:C2HC/C3H-type domain-containing protein n=1 Tax=Dunaliella salina TaxID=3046 RepID=A0ABQ7GRT7_DUNSA|nr:hypothetical protein DUNSADRAFT_4533 [Dunaliella salina]|eukprot:KAF5837325.1 hypothetical protein DUNSADRAFT_4533 [Dunaliella salina]
MMSEYGPIPSGSPQAGRRAAPMASRLPAPPAMGGMPVSYAGQPPPGQYFPPGAYPGASPASPMSQARFGRRASPGSDQGPGSGPLFPGQQMPMGYNAQGRQGSLAGAPPQDPAVAKAWALQQQQLMQQRGMSRIPNGAPPPAYTPSAHSTMPPRPAPIHSQQPAPIARQPMFNGTQAPSAGQRPPMGGVPGHPSGAGPPPMQRPMGGAPGQPAVPMYRGPPGVPGQPGAAAAPGMPAYRPPNGKPAGPQQGGLMPDGPQQMRPPGSFVGPLGAASAPGQMPQRQPAAAVGAAPAGPPGSRPVPVPMGVLSGMPNGPAGPRPMGQQAGPAAPMARQPLNGGQQQPGAAPSMGSFGQQGGPVRPPHPSGPLAPSQHQGTPQPSQPGAAAATVPLGKLQQQPQQQASQPRPISAASANRAAALAALSQRKAAAAQVAQQQKLQQQQQQQQASQQQEQIRQQQLQQQQRQQEQARQQQQQQQQQLAQQKQRARQQLLQQQQQRRMQAQASQSRPPFSTSDEAPEDEDGSWEAPPQHQPVPQRSAASIDVSERPVGGSGSFAGGGMMMEEDPGPMGPMVQCPTCSRSFNQQSYQKHAKACAKVFASKRKVFNVAAARVAGTEAAKYFDPKKGQPKNSSTAPSGTRRPNSALAAGKAAKAAKWKMQSEQLRAAMRCARGEAQGKGGADAGPSAPYQPPVDLDDRVPCPHCGRKFAELAAERHIPHCANTRAKPSFLNKQSGRGAYQVGKKR